MRKLCVMAVAMTFFLSAVPVLTAQSAFRKEPVKTTKTPEAKSMTKDELAKEIQGELRDEDEILSRISDLKKESSADGKEFYTFRGSSLDDMEKADLESLLKNVYAQANIIRADAINRQLESVRDAQRAAQLSNLPKALSQIAPTPPHVPGSGYRAPAQPPRAPSAVPSAPPAPPRR